MNADPRVMEHFPKMLSPEESDATVDRFEDHFVQHDFGCWAVEVVDSASFAGFVGLATERFEAHFSPFVEIGWRLAAEHWGRGYATEAARASLAFGFDSLGLEEIVSMTVSDNLRSRHVMEKLGLTRDPADDFDHPLVPDGHRLKRHLLYRIRRDDWRLPN